MEDLRAFNQWCEAFLIGFDGGFEPLEIVFIGVSFQQSMNVDGGVGVIILKVRAEVELESAILIVGQLATLLEQGYYLITKAEESFSGRDKGGETALQAL